MTPQTGPEHEQVRLPLVEKLLRLGWSEDQLQYEPEWRVPKTPSEATRREHGRRFDGYPVDLVIFDDPQTAGEWEHISILFELKQSTIEAGRSQLEIYLSLEPRAKLGYWTNGHSSLALYRRADGGYLYVEDAPLPRPEDTLEQPSAQPLTYGDLSEPDEKSLRSRFERLLGSVIANDSTTTRSDDRLNQLCNLLLLKLDSDKKAKVKNDEPVTFQVHGSEEETANRLKKDYIDLTRVYNEVFRSTVDQELLLDDHTIHQVVYELSGIRLMDVSADVVSQAFQIFRSAQLKAEEGQYFTPFRIIQTAIEFVDVDYDDKVMDPACGTGGFLIEAFKYVREKHKNTLSEADLRTWAHQKLYGVDKDSINVKLARAIMMIVGDGSAHIYIGDSLREHRWNKDYPHLTDPLSSERYTCIITNPPFGESLKVSAMDARRSGYTISLAAGKGKNYVSLEVGLIFLERCYRLLSEGGRLGIVLPETYFFSSSYRWLWGWLEDRLELKGILNIPMEAFQGFCRAKTNFYVFERV